MAVRLIRHARGRMYGYELISGELSSVRAWFNIDAIANEKDEKRFALRQLLARQPQWRFPQVHEAITEAIAGADAIEFEEGINEPAPAPINLVPQHIRRRELEKARLQCETIVISEPSPKPPRVEKPPKPPKVEKPPKVKHCEECGTVLDPIRTRKRNRFCSRECINVRLKALDHRRRLGLPKVEKPPKPPKVKQCVCCAKEFRPMRSRDRYCTRQCVITYLRILRSNRQSKAKPRYTPKNLPILDKRCKQCGAAFVTCNELKAYCDSKCGRAFNARLERDKRKNIAAKPCRFCAASFTPTDRSIVYCSAHCTLKARAAKERVARKRRKEYAAAK